MRKTGKKNPFRNGSWGFKTLETLKKLSISSEALGFTVTEITAEILGDYPMRRKIDSERLFRKTYFALWELQRKEGFEFKIRKSGKENLYRLKKKE